MDLPRDTVISPGLKNRFPALAGFPYVRPFAGHPLCCPPDSETPEWGTLSAVSVLRPREAHRKDTPERQSRERTGGAPIMLPNRFVEQMLADPMIQLIMLADGVSDAEIRTLYSVSPPASGQSRTSHLGRQPSASDPMSVGDGPRPGSPRPGIGE